MAQHLAAHSGRVTRMALVNAVMFDSWPVPAVGKFRDPALRAATGTEELLAARTRSMQLTVEPNLTNDEIDADVSRGGARPGCGPGWPWRRPRTPVTPLNW